MWKKITASSDGVISGRFRLGRVRLLCTGGSSTTAVLYNAAVQGTPGDANDFCTLAADNTFDSDKESWGKDEGMSITNLSVTITGTGILYVYYS